MEPMNWRDLPESEVREGVSRRVFSGKNIMLSFVAAKPGMEPNPHSHAHDQIIFLLEGEMELWVDNEKHVMRAGEVVHVPPGTEHFSNVLTEDGVLILDVFSPIREDFL